jgi:hypothetical protein
MDGIIKFFKDTFGTSGGDVSWGAVATTAATGLIGALLGMLTGGGGFLGLGSILGAIVGLVGGTVFNKPISDGVSSIFRPSNQLPGTEVKGTELGSVAITVQDGSKQSALSVPDVSALKKPWQGDRDQFIDEVVANQIKIARDALDPQQSLDVLKANTKKANENIYNYLATIENVASKPIASVPPVKFELSNNLATNAQSVLGISADQWQTKSKIEQLALAEQAVQQKTAELLKEYAPVRQTGNTVGEGGGWLNEGAWYTRALKQGAIGGATGAATGAGLGASSSLMTGPFAPLAVPFTTGAGAVVFGAGGALIGSVTGIFSKSTLTKVHDYTVDFVTNNGDEKTFQQNMQNLALAEESDGTPEGKNRATFIRDRARLTVEGRELDRLNNEVVATKKLWTKQGEEWATQVQVLTDKGRQQGPSATAPSALTPPPPAKKDEVSLNETDLKALTAQAGPLPKNVPTDGKEYTHTDSLGTATAMVAKPQPKKGTGPVPTAPSGDISTGGVGSGGGLTA